MKFRDEFGLTVVREHGVFEESHRQRIIYLRLYFPYLLLGGGPGKI